MKDLFIAFFVIISMIILIACGQSAPENLPLGEGEIIHIRGEGSYVSDPFYLEGKGILKTYWQQESSQFTLELVNTNETLAAAPMGRVIMESALAPSEYIEDSPFKLPLKFVPGEYVYEITSHGTWEVWAVVEYPDDE